MAIEHVKHPVNHIDTLIEKTKNELEALPADTPIHKQLQKIFQLLTLHHHQGHKETSYHDNWRHQEEGLSFAKQKSAIQGNTTWSGIVSFGQFVLALGGGVLSAIPDAKVLGGLLTGCSEGFKVINNLRENTKNSEITLADQKLSNSQIRMQGHEDKKSRDSQQVKTTSEKIAELDNNHNQTVAQILRPNAQ